MFGMDKVLAGFFSNFWGERRVSLMIFLYVVFIVFGLKNIALNHDDYVGMMAELLENGSGGELDFSFYFSYKFFSAFSSLGVSPEFLATILGFFVLYYSFYCKLDFFDFIVLFILFLPAFFMNLGKPSKEFFVAVFFLAAFHSSIRGKYLVGALFVVLYAILFRVYYMPMAIVFLYFTIKNGRIRFFAQLMFFLALLVGFACYFDKVVDFIGGVQARRDVGYFSSDDVRRTGFYNLYSVADFYGVFLNYCYAFFRINLPLLFDFQLKDLFLQFYVCFILMVNFIARKVYFLSIPLFLNFLIYPVFEPDLGSYLRHLASVFPIYFALYLLWRDGVYSPVGGGINVWRF